MREKHPRQSVMIPEDGLESAVDRPSLEAGRHVAVSAPLSSVLRWPSPGSRFREAAQLYTDAECSAGHTCCEERKHGPDKARPACMSMNSTEKEKCLGGLEAR